MAGTPQKGERVLLKVCLSERDVALIKSLLINAKCEISKDVASRASKGRWGGGEGYMPPRAL